MNVYAPYRSWGRLLVVALSLGLLAYVFLRIEIETLAAHFADVHPTTWAGLVVLCLLQVLVASLRFICLSRLFGIAAPATQLVRANISGLAASLLMINLLGSILGRYAVLKRVIESPTVLAAISLAERIGQAALAASLCVFGAIYLYGVDTSLDILRGLGAVELVGSLAVTVAVFSRLAAGHKLLSWAKQIARALYSRWAIRAVLLFLTQQAILLALFLAASAAVGASAEPTELLAVATVVTFLASLPISVNGWGVREFSSIIVFGFVGVDEATALSVSLLVGLASTLGVALASTALLTKLGRYAPAKPPAAGAPTRDPGGGRAAAIDLKGGEGSSDGTGITQLLTAISLAGALAAGMLVFFQLHMSFGSGKLTVNMADPLALLAAGTLLAAMMRPKPLVAAIPRIFLFWMLGVSAMIGIGFLIGVARFGVTDWALVNRLAGWGALLGYVALGGAAASAGGKAALRLFATVMLAAAAGVTLFLFAERELILLLDPGRRAPVLIEGMVQNRNAFAFQLIVAIAAGLAFHPGHPEGRRIDPWLVALAVAGYGVWMTQSKTGVITLIVVLGAAYALSPDRRALIRKGILYGFAVAVLFAVPGFLVWAIGQMDFGVGMDLHQRWGRTTGLDVFEVHASSMAERWLSILLGLELWLHHPLFGAGLGAFAQDYQQQQGDLLVIHSVPIWLLSEFGLLGLAAVGWAPALLVFRWLRTRPTLPPGAYFLALLVLSLGVFGLPHDIFYARIFWLSLGVAAFATAAELQRDR